MHFPLQGSLLESLLEELSEELGSEEPSRETSATLIEGVIEYPPSQVLTAKELARHRSPKCQQPASNHEEASLAVKFEQEDDVLMEGRDEVWARANKDEEEADDDDTVPFSNGEEKDSDNLDNQNSTDSSL